MIAQSALDEIALSRTEYEEIVRRLGREPGDVELGMFGAMWSEHCGYKNSKPLLKLFPTTGDHVIQGPGENAGIVDIGDGLAVAMKMESHNHPSAVEPFQGAATGVGGIVRDIFTMGARPIALLDSLRFGPPTNPRNRYLLHGVVAGISAYGNCIGVPTVGGEINFSPTYNGNPLVNVMAVGLMRREDVIRAKATGVGNVLMLVGADTGRDGIHGCSGLASRELSELRLDQRPTVQVGNPFMEKLLIEACLELIGNDAIVGMQDLGAAGITSAVVEAASKGEAGVEIDVEHVSRRESEMTAYDVMLSESQERMLIVVKRGREDEVRRIFDRWGLHSDVIGHVTDDQMVRVRDRGEIVAEVPAVHLAEPPTYRRQGVRPAVLDELAAFDWRSLPEPANLTDVLRQLLAWPDIASKESVYHQYDYSVQTNTLAAPGTADAAVLRVKGSARGLAVATDCNGRYCYLDPFRGAAIAVAEAARNVATVGARPIALTDCLNFGNPEKPPIYYQLEQAILGMSEACRALGTPVISGNVSLYNETDGEAIYPTPIVGVLGVLERAGDHLTMAFKRAGDEVWLLGREVEPDLGASSYLVACHDVTAGRVPDLDLAAERHLHELLVSAAANRLLASAHDVGDGGLAVTLAESCIAGEIGATLEFVPAARADAELFHEGQSRVVGSVQSKNVPELLKLAARHRVAARRLGEVGGSRLTIGQSGDGAIQSTIDVEVSELRAVWRGALEGEQAHD
ncbi:MAG TPA: phosphoribosylformylglycinamidine synthase subunit PurL [Chloroflexota bacterium]|nr:phosphoribosylformylglycinamidine synthase subunit PurL [Chloroflexota bacterium]